MLPPNVADPVPPRLSHAAEFLSSVAREALRKKREAPPRRRKEEAVVVAEAEGELEAELSGMERLRTAQRFLSGLGRRRLGVDSEKKVEESEKEESMSRVISEHLERESKVLLSGIEEREEGREVLRKKSLKEVFGGERVVTQMEEIQQQSSRNIEESKGSFFYRLPKSAGVSSFAKFLFGKSSSSLPETSKGDSSTISKKLLQHLNIAEDENGCIGAQVDSPSYRRRFRLKENSSLYQRSSSFLGRKQRIFFSGASGGFLGVSSLLYEPLDNGVRERKRRGSISPETEMDALHRAVKGVKPLSYGMLLKRKNAETDSYDPFLLDDPQLTSGRHRTVLNLACYMGSVIPYVKAEDLRTELNLQFKERFDWIEPTLSLTKIRKIKWLFVQALTRHSISLELLATAALACVYFERLVWKNLVHKKNRKLFAATCLLLACKFNDLNVTAKFEGDTVIDDVSDVFGYRTPEILSWEFSVMVALGFDLHVPSRQIIPHLKRYLSKPEIQEKLTTTELIFEATSSSKASPVTSP